MKLIRGIIRMLDDFGIVHFRKAVKKISDFAL